MTAVSPYGPRSTVARGRQCGDTSLGRDVIAQLVPTASGVIGLGWSDSDGGALLTSPDGIEWLAATNETGLTVARGLQAVGAYDGRAVAFVEDGTNGLAIWETTGRAEWTRVGMLKDAKTMERVVGGPRGWVALDSNRAWTSRDGREWGEGLPGPDVTADVIADDSGFVAVGYVGSWPHETCGDQRPFAGDTWTSSDGRIWERMPVSKEFSTATVMRLMVVDRTLIGYGHRIPGQYGCHARRALDGRPPGPHSPGQFLRRCERAGVLWRMSSRPGGNSVHRGSSSPRARNRVCRFGDI